MSKRAPSHNNFDKPAPRAVQNRLRRWSSGVSRRSLRSGSGERPENRLAIEGQFITPVLEGQRRRSVEEERELSEVKRVDHQSRRSASQPHEDPTLKSLEARFLQVGRFGETNRRDHLFADAVTSLFQDFSEFRFAILAYRGVERETQRVLIPSEPRTPRKKNSPSSTPRISCSSSTSSSFSSVGSHASAPKNHMESSQPTRMPERSARGAQHSRSCEKSLKRLNQLVRGRETTDHRPA